MKNKGFIYNCELSGMGIDETGKYYRGGFEGVKLV
jgi:hypothetical protein